MSTTDARMINGDALDLLRSIPDGTADLILTDPPYGTTACQWDVLPEWQEYWPSIWTALKPNGAALIFGQMPQALALINSEKKQFRYEIIWEKTRACGFANANKMPMRAHENVFVFYRRLPVYNRVEIHNQSGAPYKHSEGGARRGEGVYRTKARRLSRESDGRRAPRDVIKVKSVRGKHPTEKPTELLRYLVAMYTNPGDLVIDPFAGSGSTGVACVETGRRFLGSELDPGYFETAQKRISSACQLLFP